MSERDELQAEIDASYNEAYELELEGDNLLRQAVLVREEAHWLEAQLVDLEDEEDE